MGAQRPWIAVTIADPITVKRFHCAGCKNFIASVKSDQIFAQHNVSFLESGIRFTLKLTIHDLVSIGSTPRN